MGKNLAEMVLIVFLGVSLAGCGRIYNYFAKREIARRLNVYFEKMEAGKIEDQEYLFRLHKKYGPEITASELEKDFPKHVIDNLVEYSGQESFMDEELLLIKPFRK